MSDDELHDPLDKIVELHEDADMATEEPAEYRIMFGTEDRDLVEFQARTPLPIPSVGQRITVHGIPAVVEAVDVGYESAGPGAPPSVYTTVQVRPVSE